jgi:hypothetical protein
MGDGYLCGNLPSCVDNEDSIAWRKTILQTCEADGVDMEEGVRALGVAPGDIFDADGRKYEAVAAREYGSCHGCAALYVDSGLCDGLPWCGGLIFVEVKDVPLR